MLTTRKSFGQKSSRVVYQQKCRLGHRKVTFCVAGVFAAVCLLLGAGSLTSPAYAAADSSSSMQFSSLAVSADSAAGSALSAPVPSQAFYDVFGRSQKPKAPVVRYVPNSDGSVTISWTESPLISSDPSKDQRTYTLYLYRGDKSGDLSPIYTQAFIPILEKRLTIDWLLIPGKRYTVIVAAVNDALSSDDPNASTESEPVSFTCPSSSPYPVGDVNGNGVVNAVDAQIAYDIAMRAIGESAPEYADLCQRADVTGDGKIDANDSFAIQYIALRG